MLRGHEYGEWQYESSGTCKMLRVCKRDGFPEYMQGQHHWKERTSSKDNNRKERICERCSHQEIEKRCHRCTGKGKVMWSFTREYQENVVVTCDYCKGQPPFEHPTKGLDECSHCGGDGSWETVVTRTEEVESWINCSLCNGSKLVWEKVDIKCI